MDKKKRPHVFTVHVSDEEQLRIQQRMQHMGYQKFSEYARKMMVEGHVSTLSSMEMEKQSDLIHTILDAVTQLTEQVHANSISQDKEIEEIKLAISEIWRLEQLNISKLRVV